VVLVRRTYADHWDGQAREPVPKDVPILCQPEDEAAVFGAGFAHVSSVAPEAEWDGLRFARTGGRHATGEIGAQVDPVSGFVVVRAEGSPNSYVSGDTIWCDEVEEALRTNPDVIIANAGAAQFLEGGPITMTAGDVARGCRAATGARVIAVHMDAINHCLPTRRELAQEFGEQGLAGKAEMSIDGETLETSA
jgi:hypothetical protein